MSFEWINTKLETAIEFRNGKASPERIEMGKYAIFGGNGIIGFSDKSNSSGETIVVGRVGAYCGAVYYIRENCWVTDNAIIGKVKDAFDARFIYYLLTLLSGC